MAHTQRREARQIKRDGIAGLIASGNHLVAQNDEPEPYSEAEWLAADLERDTDKAAKAHARNDAAAVEAQLVDFRARGLL